MVNCTISIFPLQLLSIKRKCGQLDLIITKCQEKYNFVPEWFREKIPLTATMQIKPGPQFHVLDEMGKCLTAVERLRSAIPLFLHQDVLVHQHAIAMTPAGPWNSQLATLCSESSVKPFPFTAGEADA